MKLFFLPPCSGCHPEMIARYLMQRARSSRVPPGLSISSTVLRSEGSVPSFEHGRKNVLWRGRQGADGWVGVIGSPVLRMLGDTLGHVFVVKTPPPCRRIQSTRIRNMCLVYDVRKVEGCL